jgi:hypothetical protein
MPNTTNISNCPIKLIMQDINLHPETIYGHQKQRNSRLTSKSPTCSIQLSCSYNTNKIVLNLHEINRNNTLLLLPP